MVALESSSTETVSATEFKAKCLSYLTRLSAGDLSRLEVTKRGKVVAVVSPPPAAEQGDVREIYGCMKGSVRLPDGFDLTAPVLDEPWFAEEGILYRE